MNLIIYTSCRSEDCNCYEFDWRMEWSADYPRLGALVSMEVGSPRTKNRWHIVKVTIYRPTTEQDVDIIYLAYVHPVEQVVLPEDEWDSVAIADSTQNIHVEIVAIGKEALGVGPTQSDYVLRVGKQVDSRIDPMDEDRLLLEQPKFWTIEEVVTYLPTVEMRLTTPKETNYSRAFLSWCKPTEETTD